MNIIKDNTFNLHNSLLNNDNTYMIVTLKSIVQSAGVEEYTVCFFAEG